MHRLRTVTVLEHEIIPVIDGHEERYVSEFMPRAKPYLTEEEAQALAQLNDLRAGLCQRMSGGVKLAQYCGIVRLQTCVIELLPKVGLSDTRTSDELAHSRAALLTMLHNARELKIARVGEAPQQAVHAPLLDIFIEAFLQRALEQARRGLLARYVTHADDLPVIKGRFRAREHLHRNLGRPYLLHCEYDEFTVDNPYNRAIRATLDVCRGWTATTSTQRLWFEAHTRFASVSSIRVT